MKKKSTNNLQNRSQSFESALEDLSDIHGKTRKLNGVVVPNDDLGNYVEASLLDTPERHLEINTIRQEKCPPLWEDMIDSPQYSETLNSLYVSLKTHPETLEGVKLETLAAMLLAKPVRQAMFTDNRTITKKEKTKLLNCLATDGRGLENVVRPLQILFNEEHKLVVFYCAISKHVLLGTTFQNVTNSTASQPHLAETPTLDDVINFLRNGDYNHKNQAEYFIATPSAWQSMPTTILKHYIKLLP